MAPKHAGLQDPHNDDVSHQPRTASRWFLWGDRQGMCKKKDRAPITHHTRRKSQKPGWLTHTSPALKSAAFVIAFVPAPAFCTPGE